MTTRKGNTSDPEINELMIGKIKESLKEKVEMYGLDSTEVLETSRKLDLLVVQKMKEYEEQ